MKKTSMRMAVATVTVLLTGCAIPPTPYQPVPTGQPSGFGYNSAKVEEALYRVSFQGNRRTPWRATAAYTLYRSAEIAREVNAPAFNVLEGDVDRTVLDGDDKFARDDGGPLDLDAVTVSQRRDGAGPADRVVGVEPLPVIRTAGFSPMVVIPRSIQVPSVSVPRAPNATTYAPVYIYTPSGSVAFPKESWLIRLLPRVPAEEDPHVFATEDVLTRLGSRIVRKPAEVALQLAR